MKWFLLATISLSFGVAVNSQPLPLLDAAVSGLLMGALLGIFLYISEIDAIKSTFSRAYRKGHEDCVKFAKQLLEEERGKNHE